MILDLITAGIGLFKNWMEGRQKISQAKQDRELALLQNQARLLQDKETNNQAWQMAILTDKDKPLQRYCFGIFTFPFIYAAFNPEAVQRYFKVALASIPSWYVQSYIYMIAGIWGIAQLKDSVPAIVNQIFKWKNPDIK